MKDKTVYAVTVDGVLDGVYDDADKAREAVKAFGFTPADGFFVSGFTDAGRFVRIGTFQMNRGGNVSGPWGGR